MLKVTPFSTDDSDPANLAVPEFSSAVPGPNSPNELTITVENLPPITLEALPPANSSLERLGQVITAINNKTADTGVTAYLTQIPGTQDYTIEVMSEKLNEDRTPVNIAFAGFDQDGVGFGTGLNAGVDLSTIAANVGAGAVDTNGVMNERGIDQIDVTTQASAWLALKKIDSAVDQVNGARATLGAMQTRFENAVNNIDIQVENLSAARGRIMDADFAKETANLSRTQILQQAGTAMVAQANQIPQNVLKLLQG